MFSGEKSTLDRMLARGLDAGALPGVEGAALEEDALVDGVVGVAGGGRDTGLTPVVFIALDSELRMELILPRSTLAKFICRGAGLTAGPRAEAGAGAVFTGVVFTGGV